MSRTVQSGKGGRPGYGAMVKLCAVFLQSVINLRYSNHFLTELDANPRLLAICGFDSTDIGAYGNPRRSVPRDTDANRGYRTPKSKSNSKKDKELFYGFKAHEAADAYHGLPLAGIVLPANEGDGPQLPKLLGEVRRLHPQMKTEFAAADKAYAGQKRLQHLVDHGIIPLSPCPSHAKTKTAGGYLTESTPRKAGLPA